MTDVDIGFFTTAQAKEVWEVVKLLRSSGILRRLSTLTVPDDPGLHHVWISNISGETIPAFACMQVDGTTVVGDLTYVTVIKPTSTDGTYIFNHDNAIASGGYGMALPWGVVRMLGTGTAATPARYGATVSAWTVQTQADGPFYVYGDDNTLTNVHRGRIFGSGGSGALLYRFELTEDLATHVAEADITEMDGTVVETADVLDPEEIFATLVIGDRGLCLKQDGIYYAIQAPCGV